MPASSAILSAAHLAPFVQQQYALGHETTCQLIKAGVNHTYLVTAGDKRFVFRIYSLNWRTRTDITEEIRLLKHVRKGGIPVSYALPDASGQYVQEIDAPEGLRYGVLFSFAEGQKILTFSEERHEEMGRIMARLHQLTEGFALDRATYTPTYLLVDSLPKIAPFLPADSPEMQFLQTAQASLLTELTNADQTQLRQGALHLDIWFDNLNIDPAGTITLFDFDFCGNGPLATDVGYYLMQLHSTEADEAEFRRKKDRFLAGYESVRPLSAEEKRLLPALSMGVYFFFLGVQCERFDNWSNVFLNELHLTRLINLRVKRWYDFNGLGVDRCLPIALP
ncbi:phosphotransferase [Spirosoma rhododendri]|uniref:Phosphotransferase n=1 Tax=Spirosoma rhododendri TaxID=2728024 RepID=A0A7L5DZS2_9BACT|nr:phosphotransferase [Spirosoma rhododendri]